VVEEQYLFLNLQCNTMESGFAIAKLKSFCIMFEFKKKKLPLCLTKHYAMKVYEGVDVNIHVFLTLELVGRWMVSFMPLPLHTQGRAPVLIV
jgi:hypothetical protein